MQWLPPVLSTVVFLLVLAVYVSARTILRNAEHEVRRFRGMSARVVALEGVADQLRQQIARVRGKVYAEKFVADEEMPGESTWAYPAPRNPRTGVCYDICENWHTAQIEGPTSKAAKCECAYCTAARAERAAVKQRLVPKTNADRLAAIKRGQES